MNKVEYFKMFRLEDSHFWFVGKRFFVSSVLDKFKIKNVDILDLGSGTGGMTKYLEKYGNVSGIEIDSKAIELSKKRGLKIKKGDIKNIKLGSKKYGLITLFDVLYHKRIEDEKKVLRSINKNIKNKGYILITDSALPILTSPHDIALHGKRRYTLHDMEKLLTDSGYKIIKKSYIFFSIFPIIYIKRLFIDRFYKIKASDVNPTPKFLNKILLNILYLESLILKYFSMPIGSSILVLAQKK